MTETLDPQVYFDIIKDKKQQTTDEFLDNFEKVINLELSKAMKAGQDIMVRRLAYTCSIIRKRGGRSTSSSPTMSRRWPGMRSCGCSTR